MRRSSPSAKADGDIKGGRYDSGLFDLVVGYGAAPFVSQR
jgi:hypothetical protein